MTFQMAFGRKFYSENAGLNLPIHPGGEVAETVGKYADRKIVGAQIALNGMLRYSKENSQ